MLRLRGLFLDSRKNPSTDARIDLISVSLKVKRGAVAGRFFLPTTAPLFAIVENSLSKERRSFEHPRKGAAPPLIPAEKRDIKLR
jgi:hypothetical protein